MNIGYLCGLGLPGWAYRGVSHLVSPWPLQCPCRQHQTLCTTTGDDSSMGDGGIGEYRGCSMTELSGLRLQNWRNKS